MRKHDFEADVARWTRRLGEYVDWERRQVSGILGYPSHCDPREGGGVAPERSRVPVVTLADRDAMAVGRVLRGLRGTMSFSTTSLLAWLVGIGQVSRVSLRGGDRAARARAMRTAMAQDPDLRDAAAALLLREVAASPAGPMGAGGLSWPAALGGTATEYQAIYDACAAEFGERLDAERWERERCVAFEGEDRPPSVPECRRGLARREVAAV